MGEQPPWNPYGQHDPDQWQDQLYHSGPQYPPQVSYRQKQPYQGQPPYQDQSGPRDPQPQPYGQKPWPPSGHRRRPARKSWPRRYKVLTALGSSVALVIIGSIAVAAAHQTSPAVSSSGVAATSSTSLPAASARAAGAAPDTSPAATTPSAVAPGYSYQDGWDAASKATYIELEVASSQDQNGADVFTSQEDDNDWCISNDPNPDGTGGNNTDGSTSGDSSVWYEGCMAELEAHPPKPPVITPNTPGYSEGYALGMKADPDPYGGPQEWCDTYADSDYTYAPGNGEDQNPEDDPAVVGCLAALRARGFQ